MHLEQYRKWLSVVPPFAKAIDTLSIEDSFSCITAHVTAPILYSYVWWCLQQAIQDGLHTLYFLARDGHILYQIATVFCEQYHLPLQCRYLSVSRMALRMPIYHRMGNQAYDLLLLRGANLTPMHVLERLQLCAEERQQIYAEIGLSQEEESIPMTPPVFSDFAEKIRNSSVYADFLQQKSQAAYQAAVQYLEQEYLFSEKFVGIVDSGWNGSMQDCLVTLMQCTKNSIPIVKGYYFGLYTAPKQGKWAAWYFDPKTPLSHVIRFNNNVYECMCAAPHGTTMGYAVQEDGQVKPIWKPMQEVDRQNAALAEKQENICLTFARQAVIQLQFSEYFSLPLQQLAKNLFQQLLFRPDAEEAMTIGQFQFCDDMGEIYTFPLAAPGQENALQQCLLSQRVLQRIRKKQTALAEPFWLYGALACSQIRRKHWYHWNFACWDRIRHSIGRRRKP